MNLLSVSALMKEGATLHFEDHFENDEGNSWLQQPDMSTRIMLEEHRGLFVLRVCVEWEVEDVEFFNFCRE